jgi:hypothetical protein
MALPALPVPQASGFRTHEAESTGKNPTQYIYIPEAEFLEVIGIKVSRVFLPAIHSHLY